MLNFIDFRDVISYNISEMANSNELFVTSVDPDELWALYLSSFPPGSNEVFREREVHNCTCCRQFIRNYGNLVAIIQDGNSYKLRSIWDLDFSEAKVHDPVYAQVSAKLAEFVKSFKIRDFFLTESQKMGTKNNRDSRNPDLVFSHFYCESPALKKFVKPKSAIDSELGTLRQTREVFFRGLTELTTDSLETCIDLAQNQQLYRGQEFLGSVSQFYRIQQFFLKLDNQSQEYFSWLKSKEPQARLRNTAIGTLLCDLSEGLDVESAVSRYEKVVAPQNYKRPTALITKRMIQDAQAKIQELGIEQSLHRRHASLLDITINNLLFADRQTKTALNVFDELVAESAIKSKLSKSKNQIETIGIQDFIQTVLPLANQIEVEPENHHLSNLVSLIAPESASPNILKWDNNFSWTYAGSVTDSLKDKVKKAGGNVTGALRCSLEWYNFDDLDLHAVEPSGNHLFFNNKTNFKTSGGLDIDMNRVPTTREAVENIVWTDKNKMEEGQYIIYVHNYNQRETIDVGFRVEIEYDGQVQEFVYTQRVTGNVEVARFKFSRNSGIEFVSSLPSTKSVKEQWGIKTQNFQRVTALMKSPNHWDDNQIGNLHYFFILENCKNPDPVRGLFNEYLREEFSKHRKVFEALGDKLLVSSSDQQLSGLGFSSTKRDSLVCKVVLNTGNTKLLKIQF